MTAIHSATVDVPTGDGIADAYLAYPDDGAPHPGVVFYVDAFGLRPATRAMADRVAAAGYTVLAPNVFYRNGRAPVMDLPEFIGPDRSALFGQLGPLIRELTPERALRDAAAYLDFLAADPHSTGGPAGLTGYCMGARQSLLVATAYPDRVGAVGGFHGGRLATDDPDSPHLGVGRITAELYFGHADNDQSMPPEQIERLEKALDAAGVRYTSEVYPGAIHGYTMSDSSVYDEAAAERHWTELLALFDRALR